MTWVVWGQLSHSENIRQGAMAKCDCKEPQECHNYFDHRYCRLVSKLQSRHLAENLAGTHKVSWQVSHYCT